MQSSSIDAGVAKSRACGNCARAKAKCIPQAANSSQQCARCFRLKKECFVQPRPQRKKRSPNGVGIAELQSKLDSLVNLLSPAQVAKLGSSADHGVLLDSPEENLCMDLPFRNSDPVSTALPGATLQTPRPGISSNYSPAQNLSTHNGTVPVVKSPEDLLQLFRDQFTFQLPYAVISPTVTAAELRDKQPWLYRMIMMAASSHERKTQLETSKRIMSELATAMITEGEKSLDMLQALLVYTTWSHCFSTVLPHAQSTGNMQLIIALIYDLALNRGSRFGSELQLLSTFLVEAKRLHGDLSSPREPERSGVRPLDECRALLYSFYLSSTFSTCIRKAEGLQFSPYMDYSCKVLQESAENEADLILVACSRLQSIADSAYRIARIRNSTSDGRNAPIWMHTNYLQNDLQTIFSNLSSDLQDNVIIRITYHSVEIFLAEAAIQEYCAVPTFSSRRIDLRWRSLTASKSALDAVLTLPASAFQWATHASLAQLGFCLMHAFKNSFIEDLGWDLVYVRESLDLSSYFDQFASRLAQVGAAIDDAQDVPTKESFPTICARAMRWVKGGYDAKVASAAHGARPSGQQQTGTMDSSYDIFNPSTFDNMDGAFWQELMMDFNSRPVQQFG